MDTAFSDRVQHRTTATKPKKSWKSLLVGRPLETKDAPNQTISKKVGLAVFASDALSSTAYATQEILLILVLAGTNALHFVFPITIVIVALLAIVTLSYEQTIHAYPGGGGAYIVARDNLGVFAAQTAGAALLTDYILTVAVSVSSGVAQLVSAFPQIADYRALIAIGLVAFVTLINLRGVKESGALFAIPTYFFIVMIFLTVGVALFRFLIGDLGSVVDPPEILLRETLQPISLFLLLHAFAGGTTALTGVEAISNGVTAFREPRSRNAGITLVWMSAILGTLSLAIGFLAMQVHALPSETETVISQLARTAFSGRGLLYFGTISATTAILVMAANTAFADFPRLGALQAADGFLPKQLTYRGSRLVYSRGIVTLAAIACFLILFFNASVSGLIPLYAIGVFLSFTLSQAGMAHRWYKIGRIRPGQEVRETGSSLRFDRSWRTKMLINGFGSVCTAIVTLVFAITKFRDGAWVVLIIIPVLILIFSLIHKHYGSVVSGLTLESYEAPAAIAHHRVIIPINSVHRGTLAALRYARAISDDITLIHIAIDPADGEKVSRKWEEWGDGTRLVILDSPYRLFLEPLLEYINEIDKELSASEGLTIVVPQFVPRRFLAKALHMHTADVLRNALLNRPGIFITDVSYHLE